MSDILIGREKEYAQISALMSQRKNIAILGPEGVGKTAIINKILADQFNSKKYLYSKDSSTFREALTCLVLSGSNTRVKIREKDIVALRKMLYSILNKNPKYVIFDRIIRVESKYCSFLEYLIEKNQPLIIISQGIDKKPMGYLRYLLHNFEKVEVLNFSRVATDRLVDHYIVKFNIRVAEPDSFKKAIFYFSKGNPRAVKQICSLARDTKYRKDESIDVRLINLDRRINFSTLPKVNT